MVITKPRGLLPAPARSASGYRLYADDAVRRLQFIRQAQLLGFSLAEIQDLLSLRMQPGTTCADIRMRAKEKISAVEKKIEDLERIKNALTTLASSCRGKGPPARGCASIPPQRRRARRNARPPTA